MITILKSITRLAIPALEEIYPFPPPRNYTVSDFLTLCLVHFPSLTSHLSPHPPSLIFLFTSFPIYLFIPLSSPSSYYLLPHILPPYTAPVISPACNGSSILQN